MKRTAAKKARKAPKKAPRNKAAEAITPLDPIADTGREIIKLDARYRELDERGFREKLTGSEKVYREKEMSDIYRRTWTLRSSVSTRQALSFDGALVQLRELLLILDRNLGSTEESKDDDSDAKRLLFSLLLFIRPKCAQDWSDNYLNLYTNPWRPYEERIPLEAPEPVS